jgi:hypothetical protein
MKDSSSLAIPYWAFKSEGPPREESQLGMKSLLSLPDVFIPHFEARKPGAELLALVKRGVVLTFQRE